MRVPVLVVTILAAGWAGIGPLAQTQDAADAVTAPQLSAAIESLGTTDFAARTKAARTVRRAPAAMAVPALQQAVARHQDGYVRFRALVLLSGFNDPGTRDVMRGVLGDRNDRLRAVAYAHFEHHPDPRTLPQLIELLKTEESEFVRPALTRAIAAHGGEAAAREVMIALAMRGQDFFRGAVIEALGDYKAGYALSTLTTIARLDGPLQDDAVLALGRVGDKRALEAVVALQRTAPRAMQPAIAAAICLLGTNCSSHLGFLVNSLKFSIDNLGYQELLRASASGLAALAVAGQADAAAALFDMGGPTRDPARAAIALAAGTVALRNTPLLLEVLQDPARRAPGIELLKEAFDMLEEDYVEERFFVAVRRAYWQAPAGSEARRTAEALIQGLEF